MENDDGDTIMNTTIDAGSSQHHPQMPVPTSPLSCQSTPPQTGAVRMQETPVPAVPAASQRLMTPHIPLRRSQDSNASLSTMSAPLFTEDSCSSISDVDVKVCNAEVMLINRRNRPNQTFTNHSTGGRPTSMPTTMDYTTQGDPNQVPPVYINMAQATTQNQFFCTNNFFIPDGSNRCIQEINDKVFHAGYLENGNNAYLLELLGLKDMLHRSKFIMDEMSGQFYAIYGNMCQQMSTKPILEHSWGTGELIEQLAVTRQAFGYTGLSGPTPPLNQPQPTADTTCNLPDDILSKKPEPKNVQYQLPTFSLERPTQCLTIEERIQVHFHHLKLQT